MLGENKIAELIEYLSSSTCSRDPQRKVSNAVRSLVKLMTSDEIAKLPDKLKKTINFTVFLFNVSGKQVKDATGVKFISNYMNK